jgi:hypothetical protein
MPGSGTAASPFLISAEQQLWLIQGNNLKYGLERRYKLMEDIDITRNLWLPIGVREGLGVGSFIFTPFTGVFDGNGYTITISADPDFIRLGNAGLFHSIGEGGGVKNLCMQGYMIGEQGAGMIAYMNEGNDCAMLCLWRRQHMGFTRRRYCCE